MYRMNRQMCIEDFVFPFGASTMVEFRKRFPPKAIAALLSASAKEEKKDDDSNGSEGGSDENMGAYHDTHGYYPQRILVDKIYRSRETIAWCKEHGIQLTGPALGRPSKNKDTTKQSRKQEYRDICHRNIVEGEFGAGKKSYGLNRIMAHLQETSFCVIGIALLCMSLAKRLRSLLLYFWGECLFTPNYSAPLFLPGC